MSQLILMLIFCYHVMSRSFFVILIFKVLDQSSCKWPKTIEDVVCLFAFFAFFFFFALRVRRHSSTNY